MDLNNREIAVLVWFAIFLAVVVIVAWSSVAGVLRAALNTTVMTSLLLLVIWTCGLAWLGGLVHLWNFELLKEAAIWFLGSAVVLLFNLNRAMRDREFFRRTAKKTLQVTVAVEFVLNIDIAVLPLAFELLIQPIVAVLAGLSVYCSYNEKEDVKRIADVMLGFIGCILVVYASVKITSNVGKIEWSTEALKFALPVWMTLGVLPLIYFYAMYAAYELLFIRIGFNASDAKLTRRIRLSTLRLGHRPSLITGFSGLWARRLVSAQSSLDRRSVIREYKESVRARRDHEESGEELASGLERGGTADA